MKDEVKAVWKFNYLSERLSERGCELNIISGGFEIEGQGDCICFHSLDAVEGYLLCMEKYNAKGSEGMWVLGDIHPIYREVVAMAIQAGETLRLLIKDGVVSLIPLDALESEDD